MDRTYKQRFKSFDEYISTFPENTREILEKIRLAVKEAVPEADEVISYNMPAYKFHGILLYFAAFKTHIGFYPGDSKLISLFKDQLTGFETSKGTIRLPLNQTIPIKLIKSIAQFRANTNLENERMKLLEKR
jgi:uncharacterized protein YdhG (YjbR/CyaY superfamily)